MLFFFIDDNIPPLTLLTVATRTNEIRQVSLNQCSSWAQYCPDVRVVSDGRSNHLPAFSVPRKAKTHIKMCDIRKVDNQHKGVDGKPHFLTSTLDEQGDTTFIRYMLTLVLDEDSLRLLEEILLKESLPIPS